MNQYERRALVVRNINSPDITRKLLKTFAELSLDKPPDLNGDQDVIFAFLYRYGVDSGALWNAFFPAPISDLWVDTDLRNSPPAIKGIPAASVIVRSLYENYLIAYYLVDKTVVEDERLCRQLVWRRYGAEVKGHIISLLRRAVEGIDLKTDDCTETDEELRQNAFYMACNEKTRKQMLKNGRGGTWDSLAKNAGIPAGFHAEMYKQLSSYAHGDAHGYGQLMQTSWGPLSDVLRFRYLVVASLMLDLTAQHLFADAIHGDTDLQAIIDYGTGFAKEFDRMAEL